MHRGQLGQEVGFCSLEETHLCGHRVVLVADRRNSGLWDVLYLC